MVSNKYKPPIKKECLVCNKEFFVYPYRAKEAKYCSHDCYSKTVYLQPKTDKWYEVMNGRAPWNKGKKWSKEVIEKLKESWTNERKEKISKILTGKKLSEKHKNSLSNAKKGKRGKLANNWKGGITEKDKLERSRFRREIQKIVFKRDNFTCQMCGEKGGYLQVDHIQSWKDYIDLRFDINNCRTLCMDCHYFITFGKKKPSNVKNWGHNLKEVLSV